jgi:chromosome segregation ATPase
MRIDELPDQIEALADRVRSVFNREIAGAQKSLAALNAEKSSAQKAVSTVQAQLKQAQADLNATLGHQGKASDLVSLNSKLAEGKKTLDALGADIARATTAREAAEKQLADVERQLTEATTELADIRAERADAYADIDKAKAFANGWRT